MKPWDRARIKAINFFSRKNLQIDISANESKR